VLLQLDVLGLGWRTVFLINVPVGVAALLVVGRIVPESKASVATRIDVVGILLATAALTALVLPLVDGRAHGWPLWSLLSLAASPVLFADFVLWQRRLVRRGGSPLIDPAWFGDRTFAVGMATQLAFWAGQASYFLVLALYLQLGRGLSAMDAGLVFSILAFTYLVASVRAPALVARFGRGVVIEGALVLAAGHVATAVAVSSYGGSVVALVPGLLLVGAGMGLCLAPITAIVLANVDPQRAGAVSGLLSTMQQVGNCLGVAVIGVLFFGTVGHGYGDAFTLSTVALAVLLVGVAGCARCLPAKRG
jgi:predicted MFS family arabinose efflux permease